MGDMPDPTLTSKSTCNSKRSTGAVNHNTERVESASLRLTTGSLHSSPSRRTYHCRFIRAGRVRSTANTLTDIEITPEEVLKTPRGLNIRMAAGASKLIDSNQEKFFKKFRTIHRKLTEVLDLGQSEEAPMSLREVFLLEREVYLFLSLVGGNTARAMLRGAARVYGNPGGEIYLLGESERFMPYLLQLLKIVSRGLGKVGERKDLSLLDDIRVREKDFLESITDKRHEEHVRRAMAWVKTSMQTIVSTKPAQPDRAHLTNQNQSSGST